MSCFVRPDLKSGFFFSLSRMLHLALEMRSLTSVIHIMLSNMYSELVTQVTPSLYHQRRCFVNHIQRSLCEK